jgi:hypothetical protein
MQMGTQAASASKARVWTGPITSGLATLFLLVDSSMKVMKAPVAVQATIQLGYPEGTVFGIGVVLLVSTFLYVIPRTSVLGAVLLTGYLGGAIATQVRVGNPLFSYVLFPVYVAVLIWGGLFLRDGQLRALFSFRR